MHSLNVTLRKEIQEAVAKCSIAGCDELPTVRLPDATQVRDLIWCEAHGKMIARTIANRDYQAFVRALGRMRVTERPTLTDRRLGMPEDRRCCVPGCTGQVGSGLDFAPYKEPGFAWVCSTHRSAVDCVTRQLNGPRLINELAHQEWHETPFGRSRRVGRATPKLSATDRGRCERIGSELMRTLTNADLWKKFRHNEKEFRPKLKYAAFRQSMNRIRRYHRLPYSQQLQKSGQRLDKPVAKTPNIQG